MINKKGQVTIFIIIAIVLVASVGLFFAFRDTLTVQDVPSEVEPAYNQFLSCLEYNTRTGISILQSQGGYIETPEFEEGSEYMPFSSHLNFMGIEAPYWYYISGNNLVRENVPEKSSMENQLAEYIQEEIKKCDFTNLIDQGYSIELENPNVKVNIKDEKVDVNMDMRLSIEKGEINFYDRNEKASINSDLGKLYESAVKVHEEEQKSMFLENYTLDILRLYAPMDGIEFKCSSKKWDARQVFSEIQEATITNLEVVDVHGEKDNYFVLDELSNKIPSDINVNFMTSANWPRTFEVDPSEGPMMSANPIGDKFGLGAFGFCYLAYHFVYDYKYPVMVQLRSENTGEVFSFPTAVVIENSNPRKSLEGVTSTEEQKIEVCENANIEFEVITVDSSSKPIESEISFECASQTCNLGETENGKLETLFPQCVNGYIIADAPEYSLTGTFATPAEGGSITLVLDKLYEKEILLEMDSEIYAGQASITFEDTNGKLTAIAYPEQKEIELSQGTYSISVSTFENTSLKIDSSFQQYCANIPRELEGIIGLTKEECSEIEIPEQTITQAISGGGSSEYYFSEEDLRGNKKIILSAERLETPESLKEIQENYILLENKDIEIRIE